METGETHEQPSRKMHCTESPTGSSSILLGAWFSGLTIVPTVAKLLGARLAHAWPPHRVVHATRGCDVWRGTEPPCGCSSGRCRLLLLLLLLHQHHHALPSHLHGDHFSAALSHHLSIEEARLHETNVERV